MKSLVSHLRTLAALLLAFAAFVSCVDSVTDEPTTADGTFSMTVTATKGALSKALETNGSGLSATWTQDDKVDVYKGVNKIGELTASDLSIDGASAKLSGELTEVPSINDGLTLKYLGPNYATQNGTLAYIAANCDYASATVTVKSISDGNITINEPTASFTNQQAIVKFTLMEKVTGNPAVNAKSLTVVADGTTYTVTPASATNVLYVALPGITGKTVTLTASDGNCVYSYENADATFSNGKYYEIGVKLTFDPIKSPLTFEAKTANATVTFTAKAGATLQYSKNGGTWTDYSSKVTLETIGDKVSFRGDNTRLASNAGDSNCSKFSFEGEVYAYGNMMSLLSKSGFAEATSAPNDAFPRLFSYGTSNINSSLFSHPSKTLSLPATTLGSDCYAYLFDGCSNLSSAPTLPATTMAYECYLNMFSRCTNLTVAPSLPATTMAPACYKNMFSGCSGLLAAPSLSATTLQGDNYYGMFSNCTGLTAPPALPATTLGRMCYGEMFSGCTNLATAPTLPATVLTEACYYRMFFNCEKLTAAPILPARTLTNWCYHFMFSGCTKLNSITCLATAISATDCVSNWLYGVAAAGTFTKASMTSWESGVSGIPSGWTTIPVVPAKFSVSNAKQVYFSQGNLRASTSDNGTNWTWSFATNQYDCIGAAEANTSINGNGTVSANGTVDLFGWVGTHSSLAAYGINNNSTDSNYGNVTSEALKSDWGHNAISNGGNTANLWRTLSKDEWVWLVGPSSSATPGTNCRTSSTVNGITNARFTYATINGTYKGIIVFPDAYTAGTPSGVTWGTINNCSNYTTTCTTAGWADLEAAGCVFMPAAGVRNGSSMFDPPSCSDPRGNYWSSTSHESNASNAYSMHFYKDTFNPENNFRRSDGYSVRLVRNAN